MSASILFLWGLAVLAGYLVWRRNVTQFWQALEAGKNNVLIILPRIALALITAGFVAKLVPSETVGHWIGPETGFFGIVIATLVGGGNSFWSDYRLSDRVGAAASGRRHPTDRCLSDIMGGLRTSSHFDVRSDAHGVALRAYTNGFLFDTTHHCGGACDGTDLAAW